MEFNHIAQALSYARETGDTKALSAYANRRTSEAAKRIMSAIDDQPLRGDDILFLLAYGSALIDVHKATLSDEDKALVEAIKYGIRMVVVKASLPAELGDDEED